MNQFIQYQNDNGTFTSPKNGKTYKSLKAFISHWHYAGTTRPESFRERLYNVECQFCKNEILVNGHKKHEETCYLNPTNIRLCKVCNYPIKKYNISKGTCSRSCANTHFKRGDQNGNWSGNNYQSICFTFHEKKCIICNERNIVAVHHYDHNHDNNDPANLIPLCPTHHIYVHSRYACEVLPAIEKYVEEFISV